MDEIFEVGYKNQWFAIAGEPGHYFVPQFFNKSGDSYVIRGFKGSVYDPCNISFYVVSWEDLNNVNLYGRVKADPLTVPNSGSIKHPTEHLITMHVKCCEKQDVIKSALDGKNWCRNCGWKEK